MDTNCANALHKLGYGSLLAGCWLFLLAALPTRGQELDSARWEELRQEIQYIRPTQEVVSPEPVLPRLQSTDTQARGIYLLFFVAAAVVVYVLVRRGIGKPTPARKGKLSADLLGDDLPTDDLQPILEQALAQEDYRLAVRVQYLILLQSLVKQELIEWKRDYTNRHYRQQLSGHPVATLFSRCTQVFERVWYGQQVLNAQQYAEIADLFASASLQSQDG
ncbi:MAG: DUF4129 domain-containing protein [Bernardetiaceae bacterium]